MLSVNWRATLRRGRALSAKGRDGARLSNLVAVVGRLRKLCNIDSQWKGNSHVANKGFAGLLGEVVLGVLGCRGLGLRHSIAGRRIAGR